MKLKTLIAAFVGLCLVGAASADGVLGHSRSSGFDTAAQHLRDTWARDQQLGVPAAAFDPLRADLAKGPSGAWWSPAWITANGSALTDSLQHRTDAIWGAAVSDARDQASRALADFQSFVSGNSALASVKTSVEAAGWPQQLAAATTPAQLTTLAGRWRQALRDAQGQLQATQAAAAAQAAQQSAAATQLAAEQTAAQVAAQSAAQAAQAALAAVQGLRQPLLSTATRLLGVARSDNLDAAAVAAQLPAVQAETGADAFPSAADRALQGALAPLQSLIDLNNRVGASIPPLMLASAQALAESTASAATLAAQCAAAQATFAAAHTMAEMQAVAAQIASLQSALNGELATHACGHAVGAGKVITINLSLQQMLFYQDGCVVQSTLVATGRPGLRTPTGNFAIFSKQSPFQFISPWPVGSPNYYYPSWSNWVMEFAAGGYFIHDSPWEPASAYGPGSQNNYSTASHGCVHTPGSVMQWAYAWTPIGTPVIISA